MYSVLSKLSLLLNVYPDSLQRGRTRTRVSVEDVLLTEMARCCDHASRSACDHLEVLSDKKLLAAPLFRVSIDIAIEKAGKMDHPDGRREDEKCCQYAQREAQTKETRYSKSKELRESAGLCLNCVRSVNMDANYPCNLDH